MARAYRCTPPGASAAASPLMELTGRRSRHEGTLHLIAQAGGGVVEAYPQDTAGQKVPASFLYNGTRSLFEQAGFSYVRPKGKNHCVMRTVIP